MVTHRYKVKYGFDNLSQVSVVAGPELEKVIYAWLKQTPVAVAGRMLNGKHIIDIKPDYHYYTGWYDHYEPTDGDDWKQIQRDCPATLSAMFDQYVDRVRGLIGSNRIDLIGQGEPIQLAASSQSSGSPFAQTVLAAKTAGKPV